MEHKFYEAKKCIIRKDTFEKFKSKVQGLGQSQYLSLLLKDVIENALEPLDNYLQYLLQQGADINFTQPKNKATLLMFACRVSNINIVEMLLSQKAIRIYEKDRLDKNAVHYAFQNQSQDESRKIASFLFQRYPKFKELGTFQRGNYLTLAVQMQKPCLLRLIIQQQIEGDLFKNQGLLLHQIMENHGKHKKYEITLSFLRLLITAGYRQDLMNDRQQSYIHYAINEGIMNEEQINELMKQLKPESFKKQLTLETSPEQKFPDSPQEEQFWEDASFDDDFAVFSHTSEAYEPRHAEISEQMTKIAVQVYESHQNTWAALYPFYLKIYNIVAQLYGSIEVIGSFASKLWIPKCDIDFLLIIPEQNPNFFDEIVQNIFYKIKKLGCHYHIKFSLSYKLPMIKLILTKQFGGLEVQLFLSSKKNIATQYVSFIHEVMAYYPEIQVIYIVIRKILEIKSLHDHKNGGLKAYGLFLLIYSMRSQYQYSYVSQFLEHFAYYYGIAYEYVGELIQGEVNYKINIIDPLNSENNMGGKKTDILSLQELFKKIYYGINMENEGGKIDFLMEIIKDL